MEAVTPCSAALSPTLQLWAELGWCCYVKLLDEVKFGWGKFGKFSVIHQIRQILLCQSFPPYGIPQHNKHQQRVATACLENSVLISDQGISPLLLQGYNLLLCNSQVAYHTHLRPTPINTVFESVQTISILIHNRKISFNCCDFCITRVYMGIHGIHL